ncbi:MAG TPA: signal peptidase I [Patescibacteria group bacterium]
MKKRVAIIGTLAEVIIIVGLLGVTIASFATRIPALARAGLNFFTVTSGSMEPTIPTGSLIYVGKYKLDELKTGDIITYSLPNSATGEQAIVTHRISEINTDESTKEVSGEEKTVIEYRIKTKGDANSEADNYTLGANNIIGVYKWHIPSVGYLTSFAQSPLGFIVLVIAPGLILIVWEIVSLVMYLKGKKDSKKDEEIQRLKEELAKKQ